MSEKQCAASTGAQSFREGSDAVPGAAFPVDSVDVRTLPLQHILAFLAVRGFGAIPSSKRRATRSYLLQDVL